jgi:hypothetical protein
MEDINSDENITNQNGVAPPSLGGNTAQYTEGGSKKVRKNSKKAKRAIKKAKKTVKRRSVKKCWWKFF